MPCRFFTLGLTALAMGIVTPALVGAQTASLSASGIPRTAWGAPDLQGVWDFRSLTPMERPLELAEQGAKVVVNDLGCEVDGTGSLTGPADNVVAEIVE